MSPPRFRRVPLLPPAGSSPAGAAWLSGLALLGFLVTLPACAGAESPTPAAEPAPSPIPAASPAAQDQPHPPAATEGEDPKSIAPSAREVLRTCRDPIFIDCFKNWRPTTPAPPEPPRPPPGPRHPEAAKSEPPQAKAAKPPPPPPKPPAPAKPALPAPAEADLATFNALMQSIRDQGLTGALNLDGPPQGGSVTLHVNPPPLPPAPHIPKRASPPPLTPDQEE